jgi:ubiquitin-protein ligase
MAIHGRRARLILEYEKLINLERRSNFIKVEPIDVIDGMPPENYIITFTCRGISGLSEDKSPNYSEFHQVSMKLSREFPNQEPYLKWMTPIWHPNIEHKEPYHVCTNNVQNWYSTKSLDNLVVALGEMVQYRRYHAQWVAPFPLDKEAADWVINYAEAKGIVGAEKMVDERPILRPQKMRLHGGAAPVVSVTVPPKRPTGKLILGIKKPANQSGNLILNNPYITNESEISLPDNNNSFATDLSQHSEPVRRITLGLKVINLKCPKCLRDFTVPKTPQISEQSFVCSECLGKDDRSNY